MGTNLNGSTFWELLRIVKVKITYSKWIFVLIVLLSLQLEGFSQCDSTIVTEAPIVTVSCDSMGQIVVKSSREAEPSTEYRIVSGPVSGGYDTTSQSSNTFSGLPAGDLYT